MTHFEEFRMKLKHKTILGFVAVMSAVSMLCVGFASWSTTQGSSTILGSISAESVSDVYIDSNTIKGGDYTSKGFKGENALSGTITVPVTLNTKNIQNNGGDKEIKLTVVMAYNGGYAGANALCGGGACGTRLRGAESVHKQACFLLKKQRYLYV